MVRAEQFGSGLSGVGIRRQALFASATSLIGVAATLAPPIRLDAGFGRLTGSPLTAGSLSKDDGPPLAVLAWRFIALAEIVNFGPLRRHLGAPRADCLVVDVADRIADQLPDARLAVVGRTTIEISFEDDNPARLSNALEALLALFGSPIDLDGEPHRVEIAIGAAAAETGAADDVRLIEEAEQALAEAQTEQRLVIRDLSVGTPGFDRLSLTRDLGKAVKLGEMFLQYQPKVHLRQQSVSSAEALIRWHHPVRGLILPGDFIPAAEEARLIGPMTLWTIEQVIADQKVLAERGHELTIFVNISGQLLGDAAFVARACQIVQAADCKIGFEITETSVIRDPETAIAHLQVFAEMGIAIAIDDYGAGLSSLAYLKQLPANELKIDKMFVVQLTSSNRDPLIVRSTIDLAHALDMEVTAEGVETQAAMALLSVMGCDMVQGFLISRPVSIGALVQFLDEERHLSVAADPRAAFNRPASFWKSV
jgi:EAL domain-containing protein (putative c-di-GMP-specific phosphodiesterase class I)/GGDEF domain-containing protein